ncbi:hypothetical protein COCVIDRAFT_34163 [Bipolaris victoriae FI3]|uniref:Uncharacterized protein n=1 Tax=Bipolaris victoriae (strain FI3) TaxID=930091 RepID=W7ELB5_BIPV3|nr:hypothetical protein COCVIDRAFT_34163 [Bipolaris victoriae FI3]
MNARFEARVSMYLGEGVEVMGSGKRKRDSGDEGEGKDGKKKKREEGSEGERGEEQEKGEGRRRKITMRVRFFSKEKNEGSSSEQQQQGPSNKGQTQPNHAHPMPRKPPSSTFNPKSPPKATRQSSRTQPPLPSASNPPSPTTTTTATMPPPNLNLKQPPLHPHLHVTNEPPIPWDPIPFPCALLPDDHEGAPAAWKRLFPNEEEFGEYGGKPTGWMEKMTWKGGRWVERGEGDVYVERFLGRG